jgi:SAM-dependent methyltransferase
VKKKNNNLDAPETTLQHRQIILKKPFLKKLYTEWYCGFKNEINNLPEGILLEIGSGGGFLKDVVPNITTSDILPLPTCDLCMSADAITFPDNSVSAIFMLNVLHHIPNTENFFSEAQRVLKPNGIIYMIEPANTWFSRIIYTTIHHEPFKPKEQNWHFATTGPLSGANGALPCIIFKRDVKKFNTKYPSLKLKLFSPHTPFRYLLSGGLSYFSFVPGFMFPFVSAFEKLFTPLFPNLGMFQTIKIVKENG